MKYIAFEIVGFFSWADHDKRGHFSEKPIVIIFLLFAELMVGVVHALVFDAGGLFIILGHFFFLVIEEFFRNKLQKKDWVNLQSITKGFGIGNETGARFEVFVDGAECDEIHRSVHKVRFHHNEILQIGKMVNCQEEKEIAEIGVY